MIDYSWLIIVSVGFFIFVLGILTAIGFLIYAIMEIRRLASTLNAFIKSTEERITPVLIETEQSLRSFRKISDDIGTVTDNVRNLSEAMYETAANLKAVSVIVRDFGEEASLKALGVKTGVKAALNFLTKQIKERRS